MLSCTGSLLLQLYALLHVPAGRYSYRFMAASAENLHLMDGAMLSRTLRTLVRLGQKPNADWLFLLAEESYYHLSKLQPQQLADFVWGFGQLRYSPGPSWLTRAAEATGQQLPGFSALALVRLLQGLAGVRFRPGVEWLGSVGCRVQQLLGEMTAQELLQCVAALERLGLGPGPVLMQQLSAGAFTTPAAAQALAVAVPRAAAAPTGTQAPPSTVTQAAAAVPAESNSSSSGLQGIHRPQLPQGTVLGEQLLQALVPPAAAKQQAAAGGSDVTVGCHDHAAVADFTVELPLQLQQKLQADRPHDITHDSHQLEHVLGRCTDQHLQHDGVEPEAPMLLLPRPQRPRKPPQPVQLPLAASR